MAETPRAHVGESARRHVATAETLRAHLLGSSHWLFRDEYGGQRVSEVTGRGSGPRPVCGGAGSISLCRRFTSSVRDVKALGLFI